MRFIPSEDRLIWSVCAASFLLVVLAVVVPLGLLHHRTGLAGHAEHADQDLADERRDAQPEQHGQEAEQAAPPSAERCARRLGHA